MLQLPRPLQLAPGPLEPGQQRLSWLLRPQQRLARLAWQLGASQQRGRGLQCCITPQQQPGLHCPAQSAPAVLLEVLLRSPRCCL